MCTSEEDALAGRLNNEGQFVFVAPVGQSTDSWKHEEAGGGHEAVQDSCLLDESSSCTFLPCTQYISREIIIEYQ